MIEVKFEIDESNPDHVSGLMQFIHVINGVTVADVKVTPPTEKVTPPTEKVTPPTEKVTPKVLPKPKPKPVKVVTPTKDEPEDVSEVKNSINIQDVRQCVSIKVDDFRDEIKAKLSELDCNNVSTLDEAHYVEFVSFLETLG